MSRCGIATSHLQKHGELLETYEVRAAAAADYLRLVRPRLAVHTGMLHDAKVPPCNTPFMHKPRRLSV